MGDFYNNNTFVIILIILVIIIFLYGLPDIDENFENEVECIKTEEIIVPPSEEEVVFSYKDSKNIKVNKDAANDFINATICFKNLQESLNISSNDILRFTRKDNTETGFFATVIQKIGFDTLKLQIHKSDKDKIIKDLSFNIELIGNTSNTVIYNLELLENKPIEILSNESSSVTVSKKKYNSLDGVRPLDLKIFKPKDVIKITIGNTANKIYGVIKNIDENDVIKFTEDNNTISTSVNSGIPIIIQVMKPDDMINNYVINNENTFAKIGYNNLRIKSIQDKLGTIKDLLVKSKNL